MQNELGALPFIAEDLGVITPDVIELRDRFHIPGTRVLQFAFDGNAANPHLPSNYSANSVAYTATHDNPTTREWFRELPERERRNFYGYLRRPAVASRDAATQLICLAWLSPAALAITPLQDLLNLDREGRMNVPGRVDGNWRWRATPHMLSARSFNALGELTTLAGRFASRPKPPAMVKEEIAVTR